MKTVGLTGGIGSGKTTVARLFEQFGYAVYYADPRAKALYTDDAEVRAGVTALFGPEIWLPDGQPDRARISAQVFQDKGMLQQLNSLIHPAVQRDYHRWKDGLAAQGYDRPFALKEAAILYEASTHTQLAAVISVYAPKRLRLARVQARDGAAHTQTLDRMRNQWPDSRKLQLAHFHIFNDGQHLLIRQVQAAIQFFSR
jgi:dephospho-CoA kinase